MIGQIKTILNKNPGKDETSSTASVVTEDTSRKQEEDTEVFDSSIEQETIKEYPVGLNEIFGTLSNQRRRRVLRYLAQANGVVTLSDLAERIAAEECGKDVRQLNSQERKRVYVGLYQCHLPKLDSVSAVSYNKSRGKIEPGTNFDLFEYYLPDEGDLPDREESEQKLTQFIATLID